ncbi:MAG: hypothetical protein WC666_02060 [Candidatus Paceibacterota bacterium]|jgi:hypothetical protein
MITSCKKDFDIWNSIKKTVDFEIVLQGVAKYIKIESREIAGFSEAEATNKASLSPDEDDSQAD